MTYMARLDPAWRVLAGQDKGAPNEQGQANRQQAGAAESADQTDPAATTEGEMTWPISRRSGPRRRSRRSRTRARRRSRRPSRSHRRSNDPEGGLMTGFIAFAVGVAVGYGVYVIVAALWIGRHAADTHEKDETA